MTVPAVPDPLVRAAEVWRDEDPDPITRGEVDDLLARGDAAGLAARFGDRLQFGTAGLRGPLGAGPNRMNRALVRRATAGVVAWLREQGEVGAVVVGRDARHGSADFAADTAAVLAGAGFRALVLPAPLPTPVAAFAVRHLQAVAGIVITASHNPPQDNGYKLYLGDGAQIVPPVDGQISAHIDAIGSLDEIPMGQTGIEVVGDEVVEAYLAGAVGLLGDGPRRVTAVYTAMHGVGAETLRRAVSLAGFPPLVEVLEQVEPDPDFPTVAFPNPEEPGALDLALARAREVAADLVLANDPDADRLAVAIPDPAVEGGWRALTGDELGALLADHLLRRVGHGPDDTVVTTVVSSRLLQRLAAAAGVAYAESLTGFKWVVRAPAAGQRFVFGYEEALGYCVGELVRDKDGVSAALVAAELAAERRAAGSDLVERLDEIFRAHGAHVTRQRSIRVEGSDWLDRVTAAMASLRAEPPTEVAGLAVEAVEDLLPGGRLPPSDVLVWTLDGARLVVRPSGTEPKCKCYAESVVPVVDDDVAAARGAAREIVEAVLDAAGELLVARGL
ncbi:MAG: phospho-sugar mutase [Acidimicrobiales bacterium]